MAFPAQAEVRPYFTPSNECESKIIKLIDNSEVSIDVAIYSLSNKAIVAALKRAHDRGVKMRILCDKLQAAGRASAVKSLHAYGLNIKVNSKHKIEHNKIGIFDGKKVVTGSYNWTEAATKSNSENCLFIIRNKTAVQEYVTHFNYLWRVNTKAKSDKWFERD